MAPGAGCPLCYTLEGEVNKATCPCGKGYVTKDGLYVSGIRVRQGKVAPKEHYEAHVKLCQSCLDGSHNCFWNDEPADYNEFVVAGTGILLKVIRKYNDEHGGPHSKVDPINFKGDTGFWVKSRVAYDDNMRAELRGLSAVDLQATASPEIEYEGGRPVHDGLSAQRQVELSTFDAPQARLADGAFDGLKAML